MRRRSILKGVGAGGLLSTIAAGTAAAREAAAEDGSGLDVKLHDSLDESGGDVSADCVPIILVEDCCDECGDVCVCICGDNCDEQEPV